MVRVASEDGHTAVRIQVFERKREAGINNKPWNENSESKGKETGELAVELDKALANFEASNPVQTTSTGSVGENQIERILINEDVAKMVNVGLGDDIIVATIQNAPQAAFDVSVDGLVALKTAGVSDRVIEEMVKK